MTIVLKETVCSSWCTCIGCFCPCAVIAGNAKAKLLDQPIPANFLKLEEAVRHLAVSCRQENGSPVLKEQVFR